MLKLLLTILDDLHRGRGTLPASTRKLLCEEIVELTPEPNEGSYVESNSERPEHVLVEGQIDAEQSCVGGSGDCGGGVSLPAHGSAANYEVVPGTSVYATDAAMGPEQEPDDLDEDVGPTVSERKAFDQEYAENRRPWAGRVRWTKDPEARQEGKTDEEGRTTYDPADLPKAVRSVD